MSSEAGKVVGPKVSPSPSFNKALIHYQLGSSLQEKGKIWEAVDAYRQAVKFAPSHYESTYALASTLHEMNDFNEAEIWYKHALVLRPNEHLCYYQLGYVYQDMGKKKEAVESFRMAVNLDPTDVDTLINLGLALKGRVTLFVLTWCENIGHPLAIL